MPTLTNAVPKYRKHRASGRAVVTIAGRDIYLGPHGTKVSKAAYDRVVGEWLAEGRPKYLPTEAPQMTVTELIAVYWPFALKYYRKNGRPTGTAANLKPVLRLLRETYGPTPVADFRPASLESLQEKMVGLGHSRRYINDNIDRIRRMFRWGVSKEYVPVEVHQRLATVMRLAKGRTDAKEPTPVDPIPDDVLEQTIAELPEVVADLVRFMRLTGARPSEACQIRPVDVSRDGATWQYVPLEHKTEHHNRRRVIYIGKRAQRVLLPYLLREPEAYCFRPADSMRKRKAALRASRKTPVQPSQRDRSKRNPKTRPGQRYTKDSLNWAIRRACQRLGIKPWSANRLRHSFATRVRETHGAEAVQQLLGHSRLSTTEIYAEKNRRLAIEAISEIG